LDAPAQIINGSTMIPLRAVADAIGAEVNWDGTQRLATITYNGTREQTQNQQAQVTQTVTWIHFDGTERTAEFIPGVTPMVQVLQLGVGNIYVPEEEHRRILDYSRASFNNLLYAGYSFDEAVSIFERQVLEVLNQVRIAEGLHPLAWNDALAQAARNHSQDMATNNFLSHDGSDGTNSSERAIEAGFTGNPISVGENAAGSGPAIIPADHVQRWMNSDWHRRTQMGSISNCAGVGFYIVVNQDGSLGQARITLKVGTLRSVSE